MKLKVVILAAALLATLGGQEAKRPDSRRAEAEYKAALARYEKAKADLDEVRGVIAANSQVLSMPTVVASTTLYGSDSAPGSVSAGSGNLTITARSDGSIKFEAGGDGTVLFNYPVKK